MSEVVVDGLEPVEVDEQQRDHAVAAMQAGQGLPGTVHQQQPVGKPRQRVSERLALEPHAVGDILGRRVPGVPVAAGAPHQPAPRAVAVAVAVREVLELRRTLLAGDEQRERLLHVLGVHEVLDRAGLQLLARPAQQPFPGGVQEREAAIERDRREQVARHLEQPRNARLTLEHTFLARRGRSARRRRAHSCQLRRRMSGAA